MTGHFTPCQKWLNEVWGLDTISGNNKGDFFVSCSDDATLRMYSIGDRK